MATEASVLVGMAVLTAAMVFVHVISAVTEGRFLWAIGARDGESQPGRFGGRAERALRNQIEATSMYAPIAVALLVSHAASPGTATGAIMFFIARLAYAPIYWLGIPYLRTLVFGIGLAGLAMMVVPAARLAALGLMH